MNSFFIDASLYNYNVLLSKEGPVENGKYSEYILYKMENELNWKIIGWVFFIDLIASFICGISILIVRIVFIVRLGAMITALESMNEMAESNGFSFLEHISIFKSAKLMLILSFIPPISLLNFILGIVATKKTSYGLALSSLTMSRYMKYIEDVKDKLSERQANQITFDNMQSQNNSNTQTVPVYQPQPVPMFVPYPTYQPQPYVQSPQPQYQQPNPNQQVQDRYGYGNEEPKQLSNSKKNRTVLIILSIFFGVAGVDRLYAGRIGLALAKFFTAGGFGIWAVIDFILAVTGNMKDNEGNKI
ncbi:TM2 domain-containing protein [Mycoplasma struthionis]|uniref:TM2 domain-containing protein n=1 Tax=Mycoplasma struthionis TaxID=538220 RepID=UPI001FE2A8D6|nr:TM2 domain-containing protein [Mycoplasma struthionis]